MGGGDGGWRVFWWDVWWGVGRLSFLFHYFKYILVIQITHFYDIIIIYF